MLAASLCLHMSSESCLHVFPPFASVYVCIRQTEHVVQLRSLLLPRT